MQSANMIAGVSAGGASGAELVWFAPVGTALPTKADPFAALATGFVSAGLCTQDGFSISQDVSKEEVYSYGIQTPTRILRTQMKTSGSVTFQETNPVTLAVYNGYKIGELVPDTNGVVAVEIGKIRVQKYACIIDAIDGANKTRLVMPEVEVSPSGDLKLSMGAILERAVEIAAYPDANGVAIYEYEGVASLASGATPAA